MVLIESYISGFRRLWYLPGHYCGEEDITKALIEKEGSCKDVCLWHQSKPLPRIGVHKDARVIASLRLYGGKGGFGSMLRAIGAQIEKTTNREACRDLSGRRLRDINEEKRLKDFIAKKAEKELEALEKKRKKFEQLKETPKHMFQDETYYKQREVHEKNLYDSLDKAFAMVEARTSGIKRSSGNNPVESECKPKKGRFFDNLDASSESDSDEYGFTEENSSPSRSELSLKIDSEAKQVSNSQDSEDVSAASTNRPEVALDLYADESNAGTSAARPKVSI